MQIDQKFHQRGSQKISCTAGTLPGSGANGNPVFLQFRARMDNSRLTVEMDKNEAMQLIHALQHALAHD